jgi:hypothetical protein
MGKFDIKRHCAVCGILLPSGSQESLLQKGFGIQRNDGGITWICNNGRHTQEQIELTMNGVPQFKTANKR